MATDLADLIDGTPGRFVPEAMKGELVEAEHLARYWWAAQLADGRRVLDAGCGMGYGSAMLAGAGAAAVTAVDVAEDVVRAARNELPAGVSAEAADVRDLPYDDASFDLVVCFEVIEHIDDQEAALDEIRRVLAPGGVLAISSPNREVYVPGNPHHLHEYTPAELEAALGRRWPAVRLVQQHNYVASTVLEADAADRIELRVHRLAAKPLGEETYTLALASDGELPEAAGLATLAAPLEIRAWVERFEDQRQQIEALADLVERLNRKLADRPELLRRLSEAESAASEVPELRTRAEAEYHLERARRVIADMEASVSWRLTAPLRLAKRLKQRGR